MREVPVYSAVSFWPSFLSRLASWSRDLHANNVETNVAQLVDGLDRVGLGANCANLIVIPDISGMSWLDAMGGGAGRRLTMEVLRRFLVGW